MRGLAGFGECSSKTREGVKRLFGSVVEEVVKRPELLKGGGRRAGAVSLRFLYYHFFAEDAHLRGTVLTLYSRLLLVVEMIVTHPDVPVRVQAHSHFTRLDTAYGI
jgi:hypothetical protein